MAEYPPTIILVHPKERRSKCSVQSLRGKDGFVFWKFPKPGPEPLDNYVRLGFGGPLISPRDANSGLFVIDGTWRHAAIMEAEYNEIPLRSLPPCETAYPRVSKLFEDPNGGLATIEAIYVAYQIMGRDADSLLDDYHWANEFLKRNTGRF